MFPLVASAASAPASEARTSALADALALAMGAGVTPTVSLAVGALTVEAVESTGDALERSASM